MTREQIISERNEWESIRAWATRELRSANYSTYKGNVYRCIVGRADRELRRLDDKRTSYSLRRLRSDVVFLVAHLLRVQIKHRDAWHMRLPYGDDEYGVCSNVGNVRA